MLKNKKKQTPKRKKMIEKQTGVYLMSAGARQQEQSEQDKIWPLVPGNFPGAPLA